MSLRIPLYALLHPVFVAACRVHGVAESIPLVPEILAFPCNQFGGQEPKCDVDIKEFAKKKGAKFVMMQKISVNGAEEHPVFSFLKGQPGCNGNLMW